MPTLQDLEKSGFSPPPGGTPFAPDHREPVPAPPGSNLPSVLPPAGSPPAAIPPTSSIPPPAPSQAGKVVQTPTASGVTTGGTGGYQTMTTPRGPAVIVPNGNGTSTVIYSDGRVETIPTPK
jgi:hypothetical protein